MSLVDPTEADLEVVSEGGATSDEWVKEGSSESMTRTGNGISNGKRPDDPVEANWTEHSSKSAIKKTSGQQDRWVNLLGVGNRPDPLHDWDNLYNLQNQGALRKDSRTLIESLGGKTTMTVPQLESTITLYCKKRRVDYESDSGWMDIMRTLLVLPYEQSTLFNVFHAITTKYIPRCPKALELFRLLLQYHDPQACSHLDSMRIQPLDYAESWFQSLLAADTSIELCSAIWDHYFERADPFLIFFIALVFVRNAREEVLSLRDRASIIALLKRSPAQMDIADVMDLLDICFVYLNYTPLSVREDFHFMLFGSNLVDECREFPLHRLLCLPVSAQELYKRVIDMSSAANCTFNYFIIDTRTQRSFTAGSVPGSYNLNAKLIVDDPEKFSIAMNSLLRFKEDSCKEDHISFLGGGYSEEDAYTMMVISRFLHRNIEKVSYVDGGYRALHSILAETGNLSRLSNHFNPAECLECCRKKKLEEAKGWSLLERMRSAINAKRHEVESKMLVRPPKPIVSMSSGVEFSGDKERMAVKHVSSADRFGKRYRNIQNVFSINDDSPTSGDDGVNLSDIEDSLVSEVAPEKLKWADVTQNAEITDHFQGEEVLLSPEKAQVPCYIAISRTHMHIFHGVKNEAGYVRAQYRHPLSSIMRVTSKKKIPEFLTFRFGYELPTGEAHINKVHCFILPKSGECAKAIKTAILALRPSLLDEEGDALESN